MIRVSIAYAGISTMWSQERSVSDGVAVLDRHEAESRRTHMDVERPSRYRLRIGPWYNPAINFREPPCEIRVVASNTARCAHSDANVPSFVGGCFSAPKRFAGFYCRDCGATLAGCASIPA